MSDPISSVNPNIVSNMPQQKPSTGSDVADALLNSLALEKTSAHKEASASSNNSTDNSISEDRTLAARIAAERKAGNENAINQINLNPAALEVNLRDEVYLNQLRTAASAETQTPAKIAALNMHTAIPESWKSLEKDISPKLEEASKNHNAFVSTVRENPVVKIASLAFLPTAPFALWVMTGGETKADKALQTISSEQNKFLVNGINDGSIKSFTEKAIASADFLTGVKFMDLKKEADSGSEASLISRFMGAMLKTNSDPISKEPIKSTLTVDEMKAKIIASVSDERIITASDLNNVKAKLSELQTFLTEPSENIRQALETNSPEKSSPIDTLRTLVSSVANAPFIKEAKSKVDPLLENIGIKPEQAKQHNEKLTGIGDFFKKLVGGQAKKIDEVMTNTQKQSQELSRQAAAQVANNLATGLKENQGQIAEANKGLLGIVNDLVGGASQNTDKGLANIVNQLSTINQSIQKSSKADLN